MVDEPKKAKHSSSTLALATLSVVLLSSPCVHASQLSDCWYDEPFIPLDLCRSYLGLLINNNKTKAVQVRLFHWISSSFQYRDPGDEIQNESY